MPDSTEVSYPAQGFVRGGGQIIAAPFQFVTTDDYFLRIVSANSLTGVVVTISARRYTLKGKIEDFSRQHTPNDDRTVKTEDFPIGAGAVINLTVHASAGSPTIGQTFVMVKLMRGSGLNAVLMGTLLAGCLTATQALGWPGSSILSSTTVEPSVLFVTFSLPTSGTEFSQTVPTGARWEILYVSARYVADASAGNRSPNLVLKHNGTIYNAVSPALKVIANEAYTFYWAPGVALRLDPVFFRQDVPLPTRPIVQAGDVIASSTANMVAGDVWDGIVMVVREWLEVP